MRLAWRSSPGKRAVAQSAWSTDSISSERISWSPPGSVASESCTPCGSLMRARAPSQIGSGPSGATAGDASPK